jgi:6,7-dimethyl-8-ribityllumazine synthase
MQISCPHNENLNGEKLRIALILPRFNDQLGWELYENTLKELQRLNVTTHDLFRVPGTLEVPYAAKELAQTQKYDAIIALGIVIRGATTHYDYVCENSISALMQLNLEQSIPIVFGILTVENLEQAIERVSAEKMNKGLEFAQAAVEMAQFKENINNNQS